MKKVLFATTALVATTGFAAADVSLSGSAEMGIIGGSGAETEFLQSVDVRFTLSGATDNGLTFGAIIDLDDVDDSGDLADSTDGDYTVFVKGAFGNLTMGDTDGALDWALTEANVGPGSIADDETAHSGFNGNQQFDANAGAAAELAAAIGAAFLTDYTGTDPTFGLDSVWDEDVYMVGDALTTTFALAGYDGQILRYDYSVGDFGIAASVQLDDDGRLDPMWGLGIRYGVDFAGGSASFGAGFQNGEIEVVGATTYTLFLKNASGANPNAASGEANAVSIGGTVLGTALANFDDTDSAVVAVQRANTSFDGWGVSGAVELDAGFEAAFSYTHHDVGNGAVEIDHVGLGLAYTVDAVSVGVNWGQYDVSGTLGLDDTISGWGAAASYSLGGGLSLHGGYGDSEGDASTWSLGLAMSF